MKVNIESFTYRDNAFQAGFRFILFFILLLVGIFGLSFYKFSSIEEATYSKKVFWSFIYIGGIFCLLSIDFFGKAFILKNTKIIIEADKLYMPPFGFSKKGREIKIESITNLKLESSGENKRLIFRSTNSSLAFQLESLRFVNHDFEIFFKILSEELRKYTLK